MDLNYEKQDEVFDKLLKFEGNFHELFRLLNSIYRKGFKNENEPIYLVKNKINNDYVTAEGNRRLMCLKLINSDFELLEIIDEKNQWFENTLSNYIGLDDEDNNTIKNYNDCRKTLNDIRKEYKDKELKIKVEILDDEDKIWSLIYDRHLSGDRPGMREWSRSKYFADLLSCFKNGLKTDDENEITSRFNREWEKLIKDFKEAQFIYSCFYFEEITEYVKIPDFENLDVNILDMMIKSNRISALETTHSINKVRKLICDDILFCSLDDFKNNYLKIEFSKDDHRIGFFSQNNFNYQKLLSWICKKWRDKKINTRYFKKEELDDLIDDLKFNIFLNINLDNHLKSNELDDLDEFSLSTDQLKKW